MRKRVIAAVAAVVLLGGGGAVYALTSGGSDQIAPTDYMALSRAQAPRVSVSGQIEPIREITLTSTLAAPIQSVDVEIGDPVETNDLLGRYNVSDLQRELSQQEATQAQSATEALSAVEAAQRELNQYQDMLNSGLDPEISGAESSLRQAQSTYDKANETYQAQLNRKAPEVVAQDSAIEANRDSLLGAAVNAAKLGVSVVFDAASRASESALLEEDRAQLATVEDEEARSAIEAQIESREKAIEAYDRGNVENALTGVDAAASVLAANRELNTSQEEYDRVLQDVDLDLANQQRDVADAFVAVKDASTSLEAARRNSEYQITNYNAQVSDAMRSAQVGQNSAETAADQLRVDIAQAEVRSPFKGLVTAVPDQNSAEGGTAFTVADDSTLVVKANVRESDISRVKHGQKVEFTTPATGEQTFTGKVKKITTVPSTDPAAAGDSSGGESSSVTYPVEIETTGDTKGLLIGASAKVRISLTESTPGLSISPSSILEEEGKQHLLVIEDSGEIAKREVTVEEDEFGATVSGDGIEEGTKVLTVPEMYLHRVGETVEVPGM